MKNLNRTLIFLCSILIINTHNSNAQSPANDLVENATEITSFPFVDNTNISLSSIGEKANSNCYPSYSIPLNKNVYYKFTATEDTTINISLGEDISRYDVYNPFIIYSGIVVYTAPSLNITDESDLIDTNTCEYATLKNHTITIEKDKHYYIAVYSIINETASISIDKVTPISQDEKTALIDFYNNTNGDNWTDNTHWNSNEEVRSWHGVRTRIINGKEYVVELELIENNLSSSTLSSSFENLEQLIKLDFTNNNLQGGFLTSIPGFSYLKFLNISRNQLTELPTTLQDKNQLTHINLSINSISGNIANVFENLQNLTFLSLYANDLSGNIPEYFESLDLNLNLASNDLSGTIPNLRHYSELNVSNNLFSFGDFEVNILQNSVVNFIYSPQKTKPLVNLNGSDIVIAGESRILTVNLSGSNNNYQWFNKNGIINGATLSSLTLNNIQSEDFGYYRCTITNSDYPLLTIYSEEKSIGDGKDPTTSDDYNALVTFYNSLNGDSWNENYNWLTSEPIYNWFGVTIDNNQRVTKIEVAENNLTGTIPNEIGNLSQLTDLVLSVNNLSGSIPIEIGNLTLLENLYLHTNNLDGEIPKEFENLTNLKILDIALCDLSGGIPIELGNLTLLKKIYLHKNNFNGQIPASISNLVSLEVLALSDNNLDGNIPNELGNLTSLKKIYLHNNNLIGNIPNELGNLTDLIIIELGSNSLTGTIPQSFENLISLKRLGLSSNNLIGSLENWINKLVNLEYIGLDENNFSGTIPTELGNLQLLEKLYLNKNNFNGQIPTSIANLGSLEVLALSDNNLDGYIPNEIGNLTTLKELYLHNNNLNGNIPNEITNLNLIKTVALYNNQLNGNIPNGWSSLNFLENLWLHNNDLTGTIPNEFTAGRPKLILLNNNQLEGYVPYVWGNLYVHDNLFLFGDFEENFSNNFTGYTDPTLDWYSPQSKISEDKTINLGLGSTLNLDATTSGTANQYQWYKDGDLLSNQTNAVLNIDNMETSHFGIYHCEVINTIVTDLILQTGIFTVIEDATASLDDNTLSKVRVFPNPAKDNFTVLTNEHISKVDIYNILGEKISTIKGTKKINIKNLSQGIYFAHLFSHNNKRKIVKIIKE